MLITKMAIYDLELFKAIKLHIKFGFLNYVCQRQNSGRFLKPGKPTQLPEKSPGIFPLACKNSKFQTSNASYASQGSQI